MVESVWSSGQVISKLSWASNRVLFGLLDEPVRHASLYSNHGRRGPSQ